MVGQDIANSKDERITFLEVRAKEWEKKYIDIVEYLSRKVGVVCDEIAVKEKLEPYFNAFDKLEETKVKFEKEVQARKDDYLKYQEGIEQFRGKLNTLSEQFSSDIQVMEDKHNLEIKVLTKKYEDRIERLEMQLRQEKQQGGGSTFGSINYVSQLLKQLFTSNTPERPKTKLGRFIKKLGL